MTLIKLTIGRHYLAKISVAGEELDGPHDGWFVVVIKTARYKGDKTYQLMDDLFKGCDVSDIELLEVKEMKEEKG